MTTRNEDTMPVIERPAYARYVDAFDGHVPAGLVEVRSAGNPVTGEHWTTATVRDAFLVVRGTATWRIWRHVGDLSDDAVRGLVETACERALADPDFATAADHRRRYAS